MRPVEWFNRHKAVLIAAVGYAAAAVIAITVFVYLTFPWQKLSDWIRVRIERTMDVRVSVEESRVRFPFLLIWKGVTVTRAGGPGPLRITADRVSAGWPIGAVLRRRLDLDLSVRALGGEMSGRLSARRTAAGMSYHFSGSGRGLDLGKLAAGLRLSSADLSGTLQINRVEHDWMNQDVLRGQGSATLEAAQVQDKRWGVEFTKLSGTMSLRSGMSNLENFSAQGPALDLVGSGSLLLRPDLMDSLLNFNSRVTLRHPTGPLALLSAMASPDGHLDFALRGVLRQPTAYVNGKPFMPIGTDASGPPVEAGRAGEPPRRPTVESGRSSP